MLKAEDFIKTPLTTDQKKAVLKKAIQDASLPVAISQINDLHPTTLKEVEGHIHQIQNILIAEYARYTELKTELELR